MVPMLNPDGVARGHYRCDSRGVNLNRFYTEPDPVAHPSIFAVKEFLVANKNHLRLYLDLHAHASKRGCFIYGNHLENAQDQLENQLWAKLISSNSPWFEYKGCDFSLKGMSGKDKRDNGLTKGGSGRVGIYHATQNSHCYTLECNYNEGLITNPVGNCSGFVGGCDNVHKLSGIVGRMTTPKYNPEMFQNVGEGCLTALLDMSGTNSLSRLGGEIPSRNTERGGGMKGTFTSGSFKELVASVRGEILSKREMSMGEFRKLRNGDGDGDGDEDGDENEGVEEAVLVPHTHAHSHRHGVDKENVDLGEWASNTPNWAWVGEVEVDKIIKNVEAKTKKQGFSGGQQREKMGAKTKIGSSSSSSASSASSSSSSSQGAQHTFVLPPGVVQAGRAVVAAVAFAFDASCLV